MIRRLYLMMRIWAGWNFRKGQVRHKRFGLSSWVTRDKMNAQHSTSAEETSHDDDDYTRRID
jgi:hypothetical protein